MHAQERERLVEMSAENFRPRAGKIPDAVRYTGVSRSRLYAWSKQYPGLFRKNGSATLVDFAMLDRIITELPAA